MKRFNLVLENSINFDNALISDLSDTNQIV